MFGHNEIVGQKFFKDQQFGSLLVTSRFYTLQGEGPFRGKPAYFVRLAKCNLACSFCDTYFDTGETKTYEEILIEADQVISRWYLNNAMAPPLDRPLLVITGGEPSLQSNLSEFLNYAYNQGWEDQQIESNGTITQEYHEDVTLVVSPKCLEKNGMPVRYLEPREEMLKRADCLKFVISSDLNSPYSDVPEWALKWRDQTGRDIYVSPMNTYNREPKEAKKLFDMRKDNTSIAERSEKAETVSFWEDGLFNMKQNQLNHEYTALLAMRHDLIFNMQLHLFASLP